MRNILVLAVAKYLDLGVWWHRLLNDADSYRRGRSIRWSNGIQYAVMPQADIERR